MRISNFNTRNLLKKNAWLLVFIGFFPYTIWSSRSILSLLKINFLSQESLKSLFFNSSIISKLFSYSLELSFPIIIITLFELIFRKNESKNMFLDTSIAKVFSSEGTIFADVFYYINYFLITNIPIFVSLLTFWVVNANTSLNNQLKNFISSLPQSSSIFLYGTVTSVLLVFLKDGAKYFSHRFQHQNELFWDLHEFHHSATEMNVFSQLRHLPFEELPFTILSTPISILYGLNLAYCISQGSYIPVYIHFLYSTHVLFFNWCAHSSFKLIYPKPLDMIFMSPAIHWFHHSSNPNHFDSNFSSVFTFWDKLGGTYIGAERLSEITAYGVENSEYNKYNPVYSWFALPYVKIIRRIKACLRLKTLNPILAWQEI